ncbi:uncharacterized protein LY89DRAFT_109012 [Mollisia scopiformis]|uniref:Uncharacterized protein n=1 Tax=Mollisia scopiformis TaxID=149040 RepID=A0A194X574_MOLSC|nr:uncharacterized protein LY89DRAFT_109012 [Mollisia scopiformis]KUJ15331.1 hypothetical protein LY89DRAFT_109012 [Mollisia scopiformis]
MKIDPEGVFMLGTDGVLRSFDENHMVLDAVGLSPEQIKEMLDQHPWDQEIEDKYRGVDGTNVVDMKQLYEPDEDSRPKELTEEEMRQAEEEIRVHNEKLMQQMEQDEKDGVDVAEKYRSKSNY